MLWQSGLGKERCLDNLRRKPRLLEVTAFALSLRLGGNTEYYCWQRVEKKTPLFWELQKAAHGLKPIQVSGLKSYPGQWHCLSKGIQKHCCFEHLKIKLRKEKEHQFRNSSTSECG